MRKFVWVVGVQGADQSTWTWTCTVGGDCGTVSSRLWLVPFRVSCTCPLEWRTAISIPRVGIFSCSLACSVPRMAVGATGLRRVALSQFRGCQ